MNDDSRATTMPTSRPVLRMEGITKRFGTTIVLDDVSLALFGGETHALLGCNGAGKSTLLKVLAGVHPPDAGKIYLSDVAIAPRSPAHAARLGIAFIHQELSLVPALSIADNLFLGRPQSRFGLLSRSAENAEAKRLLHLVGLNLNPMRNVETLSLAERQLVEIAKALGVGAQVMIMDEPTSALTAPSVERLFHLIRSLQMRGVAIVYVSHRMAEIEQIAQRMTVLRDGRVVASTHVSKAQMDETVHWMLGSRTVISHVPRSNDAKCEKTRLRIEHLSIASERNGEPVVDDVSCSVAEGEIAGCYGLSGSGSSALVAAPFGMLAPRMSGKIELDGQTVSLRSERDAIAQGIGFVPPDRKTMGIVPSLTAAQNVTLAALASLSPYGFVQQKKERRQAEHVAAQTKLDPRALDMPAKDLSGGNQQKLVLGRWLMHHVRLMLLDEPTRGVDVGAKAEIYHQLRELSSRGCTLLVASSDADELVAICDKIFIMRRGRLVAMLRRSEASAARLLALVMGTQEPGPNEVVDGY